MKTQEDFENYYKETLHQLSIATQIPINLLDSDSIKDFCKTIYTLNKEKLDKELQSFKDDIWNKIGDDVMQKFKKYLEPSNEVEKLLSIMEDKGFDVSNYGSKEKPNHFIHYEDWDDLFSVIDGKIVYYSGDDDLNMIEEINTEDDINKALQILTNYGERK